jgi:hypothetical protein
MRLARPLRHAAAGSAPASSGTLSLMQDRAHVGDVDRAIPRSRMMQGFGGTRTAW